MSEQQTLSAETRRGLELTRAVMQENGDEGCIEALFFDLIKEGDIDLDVRGPAGFLAIEWAASNNYRALVQDIAARSLLQEKGDTAQAISLLTAAQRAAASGSSTQTWVNSQVRGYRLEQEAATRRSYPYPSRP